MKTLTCRELGGKCDQKLMAGAWGEMVQVMTKHVMTTHADVAKEMEKMHNAVPKRWGREMKPKWTRLLTFDRNRLRRLPGRDSVGG